MKALFSRARASSNSFISVLLLTLLLSACGGGGGGGSTPSVTPSGPTELQGVFLDSAVEGLTYTTGGITRTTGTGGTFLYEPGATITFSIGDIVIGTVNGQAVITPVTLVAGAVDENDPTVVNIVRFLMTIDDDGLPDNGIQVTPAVIAAATGQNIDFTLSTDAFAADSGVINTVAALTFATTSGMNSLTSVADAQSHLNATLIGNMAGIYNGTFSGDNSGTWTFTVGTDGSVIGSGCNTTLDTTFVVSGTLASDGNSAVGVTSSAANWEGNVSLVGIFSGTWLDGIEMGTFTGTKSAVSTGGSCGGVTPPPSNTSLVGTWLDDCVIDTITGQNIARQFYVKFNQDGTFEMELREVDGLVCGRASNTSTYIGTYTVGDDVTISSGNTAKQLERIITADIDSTGTTTPRSTPLTLRSLVYIDGDTSWWNNSAQNDTAYPADINLNASIMFYRQP